MPAGARMPACPPPEAQRQPDGAMLLAHGDGTSTRWSQRADGTWRRPETVRAAGRGRGARSGRPAAGLRPGRQGAAASTEGATDSGPVTAHDERRQVCAPTD